MFKKLLKNKLNFNINLRTNFILKCTKFKKHKFYSHSQNVPFTRFSNQISLNSNVWKL